jgi:hypothetical protein
LSKEQLDITNANYDTGRKNFQNALSGEQILAKEFDPSTYSRQATDTLNSAFGESEEIQKQQSAKEKAIAGGITSLATGVLSGGMSALSGVGNFSTGDLSGDFGAGFGSGKNLSSVY